MTTIAIPLSDERAAQLRLWAQQAGLAPEEFLRRRVEQHVIHLDHLGDVFQPARFQADDVDLDFVLINRVDGQE